MVVSLLPEVSRTPRSVEETFDIYDDIIKRLRKYWKDELEEPTPEIINFSLVNFPNPFNPDTTIRFSIPNQSNVTINIYNIRGQRVVALVPNLHFEAGSHDVVWNGRDNNNNQMGSGVYLYRFVAGDITETRKMMLMK